MAGPAAGAPSAAAPAPALGTELVVASHERTIGAYIDGRPLTYDQTGAGFAIGGTPVSPDDVRAYDAVGQVSWYSAESRAWFHQSFPAAATVVAVYGQPAATGHPVPKCLSCGYVGPWRLESILRPIDIVITVLFFFAFGGGLVYLIVVLILRSNTNRRAKICRNCKARNMFAFQY
ncbi:MAG TPA: hypothetical protein VFC59_03740 [Cryobacterium sp.]|nr:hypothetical protein [Cryobacterium sp.]